MIGEVKFKVDGKEHRARLTLGALEEIAEIEIAPAVILGALAGNLHTAKELSAVLRAAFRASNVDLTPDDVANEKGLNGARDLALELLTAAFPDQGNADAPPTQQTSGS